MICISIIMYRLYKLGRFRNSWWILTWLDPRNTLMFDHPTLRAITDLVTWMITTNWLDL